MKGDRDMKAETLARREAVRVELEKELLEMGCVRAYNSPVVFVNRKGDIFSIATLKIVNLSPCEDKDGYLNVCVRLDKKRTKKVHRIVADHFCTKRPGAEIVNHKSGNKQNNNDDNLEWVTDLENNLHSINVLRNHRGQSKPSVKNSTGYTNVYLAKNGTFYYEFRINKKKMHEGGFLTAKGASVACKIEISKSFENPQYLESA